MIYNFHSMMVCLGSTLMYMKISGGVLLGYSMFIKHITQRWKMGLLRCLFSLSSRLWGYSHYFSYRIQLFHTKGKA